MSGQTMIARSEEPLILSIQPHPTLEGLQAAKSLAISLIQTAHTDFAEWQQQQLAALTFQSAMALPGATQQLASATPVITGLGQVFQPVATAGEVQAQGFLVSPGVMGGPVSIHYGAHFTSHAFKCDELRDGSTSDPGYCCVPPPSMQSTATIYPHLRHQYAQYAAKKKYDVPPPSLSVPAVATVPVLSG
ncbi:hypothetical protein MRX96_010238 [Rhipicephalus microplus]